MISEKEFEKGETFFEATVKNGKKKKILIF